MNPNLCAKGNFLSLLVKIFAIKKPLEEAIFFWNKLTIYASTVKIKLTQIRTLRDGIFSQGLTEDSLAFDSWEIFQVWSERSPSKFCKRLRSYLAPKNGLQENPLAKLRWIPPQLWKVLLENLFIWRNCNIKKKFCQDWTSHI